MPRKSPFKHKVRQHTRKNNPVNRYDRGKGSRSEVKTGSSSAQILKTRQKKLTVDEHNRELKDIGDKISYLHDKKRVSGVVVGIRAEYYLVERNGKIWKVDRHSIFSVIGKALTGAKAKALVAGKAGVAAAKEGIKELTPKIKDAISKGKEGLAEKLEERRERKKDEAETRRAEKINHDAWKKDIEREEKQNLDIAKRKAKLEKEEEDIRRKAREGPLWRRSVKKARGIIGKELVKQVKAEKKRWKKTSKRKTKKTKTRKPKKTKKRGRTKTITTITYN